MPVERRADEHRRGGRAPGGGAFRAAGAGTAELGPGSSTATRLTSLAGLADGGYDSAYVDVDDLLVSVLVLEGGAAAAAGGWRAAAYDALAEDRGARIRPARRAHDCGAGAAAGRGAGRTASCAASSPSATGCSSPSSADGSCWRRAGRPLTWDRPARSTWRAGPLVPSGRPRGAPGPQTTTALRASPSPPASGCGHLDDETATPFQRHPRLRSHGPPG